MSPPILRVNYALLALVLLAATAMAQTRASASAAAPLSIDAQEAINKGIIAAKSGDYLLSVRYFQAARKIAPDAPEIYYDLGLAESKLPGRQLRAIAWFGAYLAANPTAANAAAVKDQVNLLEVKSQSNILQLIATAQKTADLMQFRNPWLKILAQSLISADQAAAGDIASAKKSIVIELKAADLISNSSKIGKAFALSAIAEAQADIAAVQTKAGDIADASKTFAEALRTADLIAEDSVMHDRSYTQARIARKQVMAGDVVGARNTAGIIQFETAKNFAMEAIPEAPPRIDATSASHVPLPQTPPAIAASDWINKLDDGEPSHDCALNTDPFLDLAGDLKSITPSDDSKNPFQEIVTTIVTAQNVVDKMLAQPAKQHAKFAP